MRQASTTLTRPLRRVRRLLTPVERFLATESASGVILLAVAAVAIVWANSPWAPAYETMRHAYAGLQLGSGGFVMSLEHWVNDGLMVVFFFVVGLEIKRELIVGELAGWERASLPVVGALGGMLVPAAIYAAINAGTPFAAGWGVPMATDIAFAVGVLALLGSRVPLSLKIFLLALAIVDDLGAVLVIALFYTADLELAALGGAGLAWLLAFLYGRSGGGRPLVYAVLGLVLWYCMLRSGVHATIAGVLLAFAVPLRRGMTIEACRDSLKELVDNQPFEELEVDLQHVEQLLEQSQSPLHRFEHALQPWVAFVIMPVFALFNAGVSLTPPEGVALVSSATLGVFLGLLVGKPVGIAGLVWLATRLGVTRLPPGIDLRAIVGVGLLGGIGFTMALFIAALAFGPTPALDQAKIGVLAASLAAGVIGLLVLQRSLPAQAPDTAKSI